MGENKYDLSLLTATGASGAQGHSANKDDKLKSQLNKVNIECHWSSCVYDDIIMMSSCPYYDVHVIIPGGAADWFLGPSVC